MMRGVVVNPLWQIGDCDAALFHDLIVAGWLALTQVTTQSTQTWASLSQPDPTTDNPMTSVGPSASALEYVDWFVIKPRRYFNTLREGMLGERDTDVRQAVEHIPKEPFALFVVFS